MTVVGVVSEGSLINCLYRCVNSLPDFHEKLKVAAQIHFMHVFHSNYVMIDNIKLNQMSLLFHAELGANPLTNSGIELGAFNGASTLYIGIAEAKLSAVPKGKTFHLILS